MGMERVHHQLARLISSMCCRHGKFSSVEQALTVAISLRQITDLCEMLYLSNCENKESKNEFRDLVKRVRSLEQKRNGVVHSVWMPTGDEGEFIKWKFKKDKQNGVALASEKFDYSEYQTIADQCFELEKELMLYVLKDFKRGGSPFHVHEL